MKTHGRSAMIALPSAPAAPIPPLVKLHDELKEALCIYWHTASRILQKSGVELLNPPEDYFALDQNFFSALFLYSYYRTGIDRSQRVTYCVINQCLRGMVTGCDNILDDEYKRSLETTLPEQGRRFRSIVDIMVSDRVLFELVLDGLKHRQLSHSKASSINAASLHALIKSGAQEASEENGIKEILTPERILTSVHHLKTGLLFQCPWTIPRVIETLRREEVDAILEALYNIGMGCQIMDDMVDLARDLKHQRHNYVVSLIYHRTDAKNLKAMLSGHVQASIANEKLDLILEFPAALALARTQARRFLKAGFADLFKPEHQEFTESAILFLSQRIGTERFMNPMEA